MRRALTWGVSEPQSIVKALAGGALAIPAGLAGYVYPFAPPAE